MTLRKLLKIKWSIFLLFIVWVGIVYINYFRHYHVPFKGGRLYWQEFLLLSVILLLAFALGRRILNLLKVRTNSFLEESIFSIGLGLGGLAYIVLALGFFRLLYTWVANLLIVILILLFVPEIKEILLNIKGKIQNLSKVQISAFSIFLSGIIVFAFLLNLIGALTPPIFFDALTYHMAAPLTYIQHHRIIPIPYNFMSNFPLTIEMLYALSMLLQSDILAKLINFSLGILILLAVYSFSRRYFANKRIALLAAAIFYTTPMIGTLSSWAYADLGLTFFIFLAVFAMINWLKKDERKWLILSAIFCGLALSTKYFGLFSLVIMVLGIIIKKGFIEKKGLLPTLKVAFIFCLIPLAIFLPWAIKNFVFTGNPVYPMFYNIFGGRYWNVTLSQRLIADQRGYGMGHHLGNYLLLPWNLTIHSDPFGAYILGPLFLVALPLLFFLRNVGRPFKYLVFFSGLYFIFWASASQQARFLMPIFPLLGIMIAYALVRLAEKGKSYAIVIATLVIIAFMANLFHTFAIKHCFQDPIPVVFGGKSRESYLRKAIRNSYYGVISYANRRLPKGTKLLFIGETRTYYCRHDYIASSVFDLTPVVELNRSARNVEELLEEFKRQGITHVLYNYKEVEILRPAKYFYWTKSEEDRFKNFQEKHLELIYAENQVYLYQVKYPLGPGQN